MDNIVNLLKGYPDHDLLPTSEIAQATQEVTGEWLRYGDEWGAVPVRTAIAQYLTEGYGFAVNPDHLLLTSGVSHGLAIVAETLTRQQYPSSQHGKHTNVADDTTIHTPVCFLEDPTYFLVRDIFVQRGFQIRYVDTDFARGISLVDLEQKLKACRESSPERLVLIYCIPSHHNPLGVSLDESDRLELIRLCELYQTYLIADEVYHLLGFDCNVDNSNYQRPMAMRSPWVVSVSAFTKILCPGIRCGWVQADPKMIANLANDAVLISAGSPCQMTSWIVAKMIQSGTLQSYQSLCRKEYAARCREMCQQLSDIPGISFAHPRGGYFVWVELVDPASGTAATLRQKCRDEGIDFLPGVVCSSGMNERFNYCFRLCFTLNPLDRITLGVQRLKLCLATDS